MEDEQYPINDRIKIEATRLFTRFGLKSVSIDDLSTCLHISKKTFYKSFLNKEELVMEIAKKAIGDLNSKIRMAKRNHQGLDQFLWLQYELFHWMSQCNATLIYDLKKYYPAIIELYKKVKVEKVESTLIQLLVDAKRDGDIIERADVELFCHMQIKNMEDIISEKLTPLREQETRDYFEQVILNGLRGILSKTYNSSIELESFRMDIELTQS